MLGLGLELGEAVGLGSSPEHTTDNAANLHFFGRALKETPGPSPLSQSQRCSFLFPQRQLPCSGFFAVKALLVTTSLCCLLAL